MAISFEKALGILPEALVLREKRGQVLASNLANADTPGYKARDLEFQSVLKKAMSPEVPMERTRTGHMRSGEDLLGAQLMYRIPHQASLDGNTVEAHAEHAKYAQNSVQYQADLRFINGRISGLMTAIRGE